MRAVRIITALASAAAVVTLAPSAAFAADDSGKLAQYPASTQNYRTAPVDLKVSHTKGGVTPNTTGSGGVISASHSVTITPPNGTSGAFSQAFTSYYNSGCTFWTCTITDTSGSSYARWYGSTPYNANSISLTDNVWVGGVGVSISVGSSPSVGLTVSNNTVTMSNSISNNWRNEHSWTNLKYSTNVAMTGPYENSSDSATFGYQTFYDNAG